MFDFYVVCVRHLALDNSYYWLPLKIFSSKSSCNRFIKNYKTKILELPVFGIITLHQDSVKEVFLGKD